MQMLNKVSNQTLDQRNSWCLFLAWLIAVAATLAALFIGEIMGQAPCNLCWFQRVFMFPLAVILGIAVFRLDPAIKLYALPLAGFGMAVAGFHTLLYFGLIEEAIAPCARNGPSCSGDAMTIMGGMPLPLISLLCFTAIAGLLTLVRPGVFR